VRGGAASRGGGQAIFFDFHFPIVVTIYQLCVSMVLLAVFGGAGRYVHALSYIPPVSYDAGLLTKLTPLAGLYVAMLALTNYCLRHVDITFYQILRSLVIPMNLVFSLALTGRVPTRWTLGCCAVVVAGFLLGSITELKFSTEGLAFGVLSSASVALYSLASKRALDEVGRSTFRLMHYTTLVGLLLLLPVVALSGELPGVLASPQLASRSFWALNTAAAVCGFMINVAFFSLINSSSPLTTHIAGCAKSALQAWLSVLIFGNAVTPLNALGIVLTLVGSFVYSLEGYFPCDASCAAQPPTCTHAC
jgi:GDP-fucose transporter C1